MEFWSNITCSSSLFILSSIVLISKTSIVTLLSAVCQQQNLWRRISGKEEMWTMGKYKAPGHLQFWMLSWYIPHSQTVLFASPHNFHYFSVSYCHQYPLSTTSLSSSLSHAAPLSSASVTLHCTPLDTLCYTQCLYTVISAQFVLVTMQKYFDWKLCLKPGTDADGKCLTSTNCLHPYFKSHSSVLKRNVVPPVQPLVTVGLGEDSAD